MNRKSEKAVNDAIQYLCDLIACTDDMNVADQATEQIARLQESLKSSATSRHYYGK